MSKLISLAIAAVVTSASFTTAAVAYSQEATAELATDEPVEVDPYDTAKYAEWQFEFENLVVRLRERYPETYSGAEFGDDHLSGTVRFVGTVPSDSVDLIESVSGVDATSTGTYLERDRDELQSTLAQAAETVLGLDIAWTAGWYEPTRSFYVLYNEADIGAPSGADASAAIRALVNIPEQFPLKIDSHDTYSLIFQDLRAGRKIWKNQVFQCSSAFPVKSLNGAEIGLLTAGHCPGVDVAYAGPISAAYFTVLANSQITDAVSNGGDFRWLWSNTMFDGYTDLGAIGARKFSTAGTVIMGSSVCKYGTVTAYGCGSVSSLISANIVLPPESGGGTRRVAPELCSTNLTGGPTGPGDSGGPWFYGTTAYGIHSAGNNATISCFTRVTNALSRFGLGLWAG